MRTLSIRNVPEHVVAALRQRARRNSRSLQDELMAILNDAVGDSQAAEPKPRHRPGGTVGIEQIAREHRRRWPQPIDFGPRAVDIIRRDRDAR
ncbi:MAG: Arc family DNA-binding protein [Pseudomonadales bacterium]